MAVTNRSQLANGTQTQQGLYNQSIARKAQLENQQKYLQMAQASPAFAIGNLIGNLLADSYNSRGVNKEKQAISEALANYKSDNDYNAMNNILNSPQIQNGTTQNFVPADGISMGVGNMNLGENVLPAQSENSVVPELPTRQSMNSFDLDKFKAKYFEDARGRGRTDAQINEAWSTMQPQITELANKAKEARIDTALQSMAPDENGKYAFGEFSMSNPQFINYLRPLMKDNPEMATYLMKGATAKDSANAALKRQAYANAAQLELQNRNQQFQLGRDNTNNAFKLALAKLKQNLKDNNVTSPKTSMQEYNAAAKEYDAMIKKNTIVDMATGEQKIRPVEEWDSDDLSRAKRARQIMGLANGEQSNVPKKDSTSLIPSSTMDYNQVTRFVTRAIAEGKSRGFSNQEISQVIKNALKNKRQNGDYVDQVLEEANWNAF